MTYYLYYLLTLNIFALILMFLDKRKARKNNRRVSESFFAGVSLMGGFLGILIGGYVFRHKTIKRSFQLKILATALLHILCISYIYYKLI